VPPPITGFFAGGAAIIAIAEHPSRMQLSKDAALAQWKESYQRAAPWQVRCVLS
jgi:hypothetical protein